MFGHYFQKFKTYSDTLKIWQNHKAMDSLQIFDVPMGLSQHTTKTGQSSVNIRQKYPRGVVVGVD